MKVPLEPEAARALTFQHYPSQPDIDGVGYFPLKKHRALEGSFLELLRLSDGSVEGLPAPFTPRQLNLAQAAPGRVNAFHLHPKEAQDDLWCVLDGILQVWLADLRAGSLTQGHKRCYLLSAEEPGWLFIPAGVAHGYRAGSAGALLLYAVNVQFNPQNPDEGRLPWDYFGASLWEEDRG